MILRASHQTPRRRKKNKTPKGKGKEQSDDPEAKDKSKYTQKQISQALREATTTRELFLTSTSSARQLLDAIKSDSEWSWAVTLAPRVSSLLESLQLDPAEQRIINLGMKDARKGMADDDFLKSIMKIKVGIGETIKKLELEVRRLKVMHASQKAL